MKHLTVKSFKTIKSLDLIEFIAIILIVIMHFCVNYGVTTSLFGKIGGSIIEHCDLLVELLFMISGLVIALGYSEKLKSGLTFRKFMGARLKRLYPMYFAGLLFTMFSEVIHSLIIGTTFQSLGTPRYSLFAFINNIFMIQRVYVIDYASFNGVTWYVCVLMTCYLIFFMIFSNNNKSEVRDDFLNCKEVIFLVALILCSTIIIYEQIQLPILNIMMARGVLNFNIGVLIAGIYKILSIKKIKVLTCVYAFLVMLWCGFSFVIQSVSFDSFNMCLSFCIYPILILLCISLKCIDRCIPDKIILLFKKIAYPLYLLHVPTMYLIDIVISDKKINMVTVVIYLFLSIIISIIAMRVTTYVESKINRIWVEL